jgi:argininosuccinate synthase
VQALNMTPADKIEYARARNVPVPDARAGGYSVDTNLWGRAIASGGLEDGWVEPPEEIYTLTRSPQD